jgi:CHAT domain-containing protein/tetratricopeptide (TPR) repeat protein
MSADSRPLAFLVILLVAVAGRAQDSRASSRQSAEERRIVEARAAVEAADRSSGPQSRDAAIARRVLGERLGLAGRWEEACEPYRTSLAILERDPSTKPQHVAIARGELAGVLFRAGRVDEALPAMRGALESTEQAFGKDHRRTASVLFALSGIEFETGRLASSEASVRRAIEILRSLREHNGAELVRALHALGAVLVSASRQAEARATFAEAARIAEDDPSVPREAAGTAETHLGVLEDNLGRHGEALRHFERALAILEAEGDGDRRDDSLLVGNLAHALVACGRPDEARRMFERAIATAERFPGHRRLGYLLVELGNLHLARNEIAAAEALALRAVAVERAVSEPNPISLARALRSLASARHAAGRLADALTAIDEACALATPALGDHRSVAYLLQGKARILAALGRRDEARAAAHAALLTGRHWLAAATGALSETERLSSLALVRFLVDDWLGMALADKADPVAIADEVLAWKGQVLRALHAERTFLRGQDDPESAALRSRLARIADDLAPESLLAPTARPPQRARELVAERERVERALAARVPKAASGPAAGAAAIAAALQPDEALIDWFAWARSDVALPLGRAARDNRLLAIVLRAGRPPAIVDCGDFRAARNAASAHVQLASRFVAPDPAAAALAGPAGAAARVALWDPVAPHLDGVTRAFLVPDSFVGALPFETLPGKAAGSYLIEDLAIVYLPSAAERLPRPREPVGRGVLLVGGVDFGAAREPPDESTAAWRAALGLPLSALPRTAEEVAAIDALLARAGIGADAITRLEGAAATEAAVKASVAGRRLVHLATHGIFAAERADVPGGLPSASPFLRSRTPIDAFAPFTRAAVALAGVNARGGAGADDGLLTAAEAAWLELGGCDLVTLSGCESGLGAVRSGESLLGLRRAFHLAGARTTVTALWRVGDEAAREVMTALYDGLLNRRLGKAAALREAQLWVLRRNRERAGGQGLPGTWGAFVLEGAWN